MTTFYSHVHEQYVAQVRQGGELLTARAMSRERAIGILLARIFKLA